MRVLVTGGLNPYGRAVAQALAEAGHTVRAFGVPAGTDPFQDPRIECFPGTMEVSGSMEPVAVECKAIVHCAGLDAVGPSRRGHALHIERGALYARFAAERELVDLFVAVFPGHPEKAWSRVFARAEETVRATNPLVPHSLVRAGSPEDAAREVAGLLARMPVEEAAA